MSMVSLQVCIEVVVVKVQEPRIADVKVYQICHDDPN